MAEGTDAAVDAGTAPLGEGPVAAAKPYRRPNVATANDHGWMAPCGADAINEPARYKEAWTKLSVGETKTLAISWGLFRPTAAGTGRGPQYKSAMSLGWNDSSVECNDRAQNSAWSALEKDVRVAWLEERKKQIGTAPSNWRQLADVNNQHAWNLLDDDERVRLRVLYDTASGNRNIGPTLDIGLNQPTVHPVGQAKRKMAREPAAAKNMSGAAAQFEPAVEALFRQAGLTATCANGGGAKTVVSVMVTTNCPLPLLDGHLNGDARGDRTLVFKTPGGGSLAHRVGTHMHAMHAAKTAQNAPPTWQPQGASQAP